MLKVRRQFFIPTDFVKNNILFYCADCNLFFTLWKTVIQAMSELAEGFGFLEGKNVFFFLKRLYLSASVFWHFFRNSFLPSGLSSMYIIGPLPPLLFQGIWEGLWMLQRKVPPNVLGLLFAEFSCLAREAWCAPQGPVLESLGFQRTCIFVHPILIITQPCYTALAADLTFQCCR